jgi:serine phosphatase RsbU (regulator of sigma subunit)
VSRTSGGGAALRGLVRASHLAAPDDLPELAQRAGRSVGAQQTTVFLIDYDQVVLLPLTIGAGGDGLPVEGTLAGRVFSDTTAYESGGATMPTFWAPLLNGTERLGVVRFVFPEPLDDQARLDCNDVAAMLAELILTRAQYGDLVEKVRRRIPMTVPAEIQWRLLPPLTFVSRRVAVSGVLAPTAEVAGDSFDYAVNGDVTHVAIFDAMGHGLEAALLAAVAVSALRSSRRTDLSLVQTVQTMNDSIAAQFGPDKFVTAIVGQLDTRTGVWSWITCGHPPTLLLRRGHVVKTLDREISPPLGLRVGDYQIESERLEPGDRLLLYTDGVTEARDSYGVFFGTERLAEFVTKEAAAGRPAPETLRRLNLSILAHQDGALQDDATTVVVEWLTDEAERSTP